MSIEPRISIVTPFLNAEKFIEEAIESVFAQTYDNWELLLVDNASTDGSTEIALRYFRQYPEKVCYLQHSDRQDHGVAASRNLGIAQSRGEFIAFLDADDVWLPGKLERQVSILEEHPGVGLVFNCVFFWYEDGAKVPKAISLLPGMHEHIAFLSEMLRDLDHAAAPPSTLMMKKTLALKIGGFEESLTGMFHLFEDAAFWFKIGLNGTVYYDPECLSLFRRHPSSLWGRSTLPEQQFARMHLYAWFTKYLKHYTQDKFQLEAVTATARFYTVLLRYLVDMNQIEPAAELVQFLGQQGSEPANDAEWNYLAAFSLHAMHSDSAGALRRYKLALKEGYDEFWVRYNRGALHAQLENFKDARKDLKRAVTLNPVHDGARQMLKQIEDQKEKVIGIR